MPVSGAYISQSNSFPAQVSMGVNATDATGMTGRAVQESCHSHFADEPRKNFAISHPGLATFVSNRSSSPIYLPSAAHDVLDGLSMKLANMDGISTERKNELAAAFNSLKQDIAIASERNTVPVYIMEGATGVPQTEGRPSTDPDENMALKVIAVLARMLGEAPVVAVPDAANVANTRKFLEGLGAQVESIEAGTTRQSGVIYLSRLDDEDQMKTTASQTEQGSHVVVLGPPFGHATTLLGEKSEVLIMGAGKLEDNNLQELSTNMKGHGTESFVRAVIDAGATQISSKSMGPMMAISLEELVKGAKTLITEADKQHWANNSCEQFLGLAPHHLMTKRLDQGSASDLFSKPINIDPKGKDLVYTPLLAEMEKNVPAAEKLAEACVTLDKGYAFLMQDGAGKKARQNLIEIATAHRHDPGAKTADDTHCLEIINRMSDQHAVHAFAALSLAFKSIYDEKTSDAWGEKSTAGEQWKVNAFRSGYSAKPGKQVPYDAAVVLAPVIGIPVTAQEKKLAADKALLLMWSDLS